MIAWALFVVAAVLCGVSRRECRRLEKLLVARDRTIAAASTAHASERAARLRAERDPRNIHRQIVADLHPPRFT